MTELNTFTHKNRWQIFQAQYTIHTDENVILNVPRPLAAKAKIGSAEDDQSVFFNLFFISFKKINFFLSLKKEATNRSQVMR